MIESIHDFSFEEDGHRYISEGKNRLSATGMLKNYGLIDFTGVDPDVLERKRAIGKLVHSWTATHDLEGHADLMAVPEEAEGYCLAWERFRRENSAFEVIEVEKPMMGSVYGVYVGCTPDRKLRYKRTREILPDLKCSACKMPWWKVQTGIYEMVQKQSTYLGQMERCSVQLFPDARYSVDWHRDNSDADAALAMFALHAWKKNNRII
jgi:hypothetical protein